MVSLTITKRDPAGILKHVYLCLGKERMAYQDLVFFIAYDLLAYPPSTCEKLIAAGKNEGLLTISPDKIVEFNIDALDRGSSRKLAQTGEASYIDIIKAFSDDDTITKAMALKDQVVIEVTVTTTMLVATTSGLSGQALVTRFDVERRVVHQDYDEPVDAFTGRKTFLKHLIKIVVKHKKDALVLEHLRAVYRDEAAWSFTYQHVMAGEKRNINA